MIRKCLPLLLFVFLSYSGLLRGQQESQYSLSLLNPYAFNAGFAGMDYSLSATGVFRRQWVDLDFTPTTQQLNVHAPTAAISGGLGLSFDNDDFGALQRTRFGIGYAYHLSLGEGTLAIGARANIQQYTLDGSLLRTPEGSYIGGNIDHNDPILPNGAISGSSPSFDVGVYYKNEVLEFGVGVNNLTESVTDLNDISLTDARTITANAAYNYELTYNVRLRPHVIVQSDLVQTQMTASILAEYNENYFGGLGYRGFGADNQDALFIMAGLKIGNNIKLAYAYDVTLSGLQQVSSGTHEILINYNLNKRYIFSKPPNTIYNPRAF